MAGTSPATTWEKWQVVQYDREPLSVGCRQSQTNQHDKRECTSPQARTLVQLCRVMQSGIITDTRSADGFGIQASEGMMVRRMPRWRAGVALVAIYALILQALLYSLAPSAHVRPNPHDSQSVDICSWSDDSPAQGESPGAPIDHLGAACCILCPVSGLDVANANIRVAGPDYQSSRSSPLTAWAEADGPGATELLPINPRAPPRFT